MICAVALLALTACGSGYNKDKAKELNDRITDAQKDGKDLNDDEYEQMIDMWLAIQKEEIKLASDTIGNKDKADKLDKDKDFQNMKDYGRTFSTYLSIKEDKLSNDLTKKYYAAQKEAALSQLDYAKKMIQKSTYFKFNRK